jgi:TP901 family phage tail tape measure protein
MESVFKLSVIVNMIDNLSRPIVGVRKEIDTTVSSIEKMQAKALNMAKQGALMTGLGSTITNAVMQPVNATMETKRAIGELSTVGVNDLIRLENAATEFSNKWAGTSKSQFITAAYDVKSGIASLTDEGVAKYTELSGVTATATKSTISEMTNLFATGYGIYKNYYSDLSDIQFGELFSAGIAKSVQQFKTTGSGMAQSIQALGASATNASVPMEEQLSILGMLQATMSGSEAGTKYSAFLRSAAKAGEELGLSFLDANNNLMSMPEILGVLRGQFGDTLDAAEKMKISKAFGSEEAIKLVDLLYGKTGDLQNNILTLYGSMGQGINIATDMANKINSTDPSKFDIIKQQVHNISETLGNAMSPAVMDVMNSTGQLLNKVGTWAQNNQELAGTILKIILAFGILVSISGTAAIAFGSIGFIGIKLVSFSKIFIGSLGKLKGVFTTLRIVAMYAGDGLGKFGSVIFTALKALPGLIGSVWSFTAALLANPITWIVIGVIALITGLYLLWKNWDKVSQFLSGVWNSAVTKVGEGIDWMKDKIDSARTIITGIWTGIKEDFTNAITGFLPKVKESGAKIFTTLTEGIKSVINKPAELVKEGLGKIRNLLPFSDAKVGPLSKLTLSGKKIFETINVGMNATKSMPQQTFENAMNFGKNTQNDNSSSAPKKSNSFLQVMKEFTNNSDSKTTTDRTTVKGKDKTIIVQKVENHFEIKDLKDITLMKRLLEDLDDIDNSTPDDPDLVTA